MADTKDPSQSSDSDKSYRDVDNVVEYKGLNDEAEETIRELARRFSTQISVSEGDSLSRRLSRVSTGFGSGSAPQNSYLLAEDVEDIEIDPRLDPNSPQFSSKSWVRNNYNLMMADSATSKIRTLGVSWKNLNAFGYGSDSDYQLTVYNVLLRRFNDGLNKILGRKGRRVTILRKVDGLIRPGELVVVLGRPGAGCTTFLRTISARTFGFHLDENTQINYSGMDSKDILHHFRGDVVYNAESDVHFPHLTVGETLEFAASLRVPRNRPAGIKRDIYAHHMRDVIMASYGLLHTMNTKVGNDYVRGVSGGERKRVSIAELSLSGAPLQCWDNSTRGLDSATAAEFVKSLAVSSEVMGVASLVAIYQCSQEVYDMFNKVVLLYEGRQIYFGSTQDAKKFFLDMGYDCPSRQTTADFLTSLTNPAERIVRPGFEDRVPRTPDEFERAWLESPEYAELIKEIDEFNSQHPYHGEDYQAFMESHRARQAKHTLPGSSNLVNYGMQVKYCVRRGVRRTLSDLTMPLSGTIGNSVMALILGSIFYNLPQNSGSFYLRTATLFFAVLFNAFASLLEIFALYEGRPIVEKHNEYALYHPSADAVASVIVEMPQKIIVCLVFNLTLYFMANLRREPGPFFHYLLNVFTATLIMSHIFRFIGACTRTLAAAMTPASLLMLALVIYTGFVIPTRNMLGWSRWINYLDPLAYMFENLIAIEFHNREFPCSSYIPAGPGTNGLQAGDPYFVCSAVSAVPGATSINGTEYIWESFRYTYTHVWRNWGIGVAFAIVFLIAYFIAVELNQGTRQKGEILLFQRSYLKKLNRRRKAMLQNDEEAKVDELLAARTTTNLSRHENLNHVIQTGTDIFHWKDVCYDIKIKGEPRRLLDHVDGWVKPGTLTALMGASGAGKTTLLDVLANRVTMGVVTGGMFVNGHERDESFQRSTGYAQQQDLHLPTSTVREALLFSAVLRQERSIPYDEKVRYVDDIIDILDMAPYADAVVGVAGEGLNVEQRKRLTIGVELAAKPQLLLFLDEPTSGLDSQTAWSVCQLLRKLADSGQAILCTIHQPSALLIQEFDRLLFLARGGRTVYFGDIGENSSTLTGYFEKYGAPPCPPDANPTEWMLEVIGAAPGSKAAQDYHQVWLQSEERAAIRAELDQMQEELSKIPLDESPENKRQFAAPLHKQYFYVTKRVFEQYWRSPAYIWAKLSLCTLSALFNGFSFFKADNTLQGLQNQMFSVFMFTVIFNNIVQQMLPYYVQQRSLYEVRERPSKTFSWKAFIAAQITVEIPWQLLVGTLAFLCWYYPVGLYHNAELTDSVTHRSGMMYFYISAFFIFSTSMGQLCVAGIEIAENAANIANLLFTLCLAFCGVLVTQQGLPGFWIFMYRCNPITYFIQGVLSVGLADSTVECASYEYVSLEAVPGTNCEEYLSRYMSVAGGYVLDPNATECRFCSMSSTNVFLESIDAFYSQAWRNIGIFICFIAFNYMATIFLYWLVRVPKKKDRVKNE
ncbi:hypothetical protein CANCADRAFT_103973 [Tortispora caseinolytica NRRL Y-17796]|uniref:ABC transporter domain-containing protein n=1 Tax=Tortispora caseinolytica NRRL Y-17796 TaxID=767744 RepID=A0A1E4TEV9_9ASCO|nr:hypothetical protein CANCADRAFT_103973 [Tortispora caseinolytica NRRL Y-17796]